MPKVRKVTGMSLKKLFKEKKVAEKIAQQDREEARFNATVRRVAQSVATPMDRSYVNVYETTDKPIATIILEHRGKLDATESEWAPWSSYTRLAQSIKRQRQRQQGF